MKWFAKFLAEPVWIRLVSGGSSAGRRLSRVDVGEKLTPDGMRPEILHALDAWRGKRIGGVVVNKAIAFALAALLAGCAGHVEMLEGLSGEEHRAYTRADSSCDGRVRSRDPVCYNPKSEKPQH